MVVLVSKLWFSAITIYPFILIREKDYSKELLNHEYVHLLQQKEMLIVFAYLWYWVEFFIKFVYYRNTRKAYRAISFEREAIAAEPIIGYCGNRKPFAWFKFVHMSDDALKKLRDAHQSKKTFKKIQKQGFSSSTPLS